MLQNLEVRESQRMEKEKPFREDRDQESVIPEVQGKAEEGVKHSMEHHHHRPSKLRAGTDLGDQHREVIANLTTQF